MRSFIQWWGETWGLCSFATVRTAAEVWQVGAALATHSILAPRGTLRYVPNMFSLPGCHSNGGQHRWEEAWGLSAGMFLVVFPEWKARLQTSTVSGQDLGPVCPSLPFGLLNSSCSAAGQWPAVHGALPVSCRKPAQETASPGEMAKQSVKDDTQIAQPFLHKNHPSLTSFSRRSRPRALSCAQSVWGTSNLMTPMCFKLSPLVFSPAVRHPVYRILSSHHGVRNKTHASMESVYLIHGCLVLVLKWPHPFIAALQSIKISISLCLFIGWLAQHGEKHRALLPVNIFSFALGESKSIRCPWTFQKLSKGTCFVCV